MKEMINILVTGANGQLASELKDLVSNHKQFNFVFADRKLLDVSKQENVHDYFHKHSIDFCINTAAYTAVDNAEKDSDTAYLVNSKAIQHIVSACEFNNTKLIHISTDFVFDGKNSFPYTESEPTNPLSIYGKSKLKGEKYALAADHIVIRTSWLYSCKYGNNFLKTMIRLGSDRDELNIIADQKGTPTNARDLALVVLGLIGNNNKEKIQGLYHFSNSGEASWFDFAQEIFSLADISCKVNPIPTTEYPTPAERPKYSVMDKSKIVDTFSIELIDWRESLKTCFSK